MRFLTVIFALLIIQSTDLRAQLFGPQEILGFTLEVPQGVQAVDLDNDGDDDLLIAGKRHSQVGWLESDGVNFKPFQLIETVSGAATARAVDLDGDGLKDIVCGAIRTEKIFTIKNLGGGTFGPKKEVDDGIRLIREIDCKDIDNDGDNDIAVAHQNKVRVYFNDGTGNFGPRKTVTTTPSAVQYVDLTDVDNDGDLDVISGTYYSSGRVVLNENLGTSWGADQLISVSSFVYQIYVEDMNADGNDDILVLSSPGDITLIPNVGGSFGAEIELISTPFGSDAIFSITALDYDFDGMNDVVYTRNFDKLNWIKNLGGLNFDSSQLITNQRDLGWQLSCDYTGDGIDDIVSINRESAAPREIIAWPNTGGVLSTPPTEISQIPIDPWQSTSADLDLDGDMDLLVAGNDDFNLLMYENIGSGKFNSPKLIDLIDNWSAPLVSDMDNDGLPDIIVGTLQGKIHFYKNLGGGNFSDESVIASSLGSISANLVARDLDADGNKDLVFGSADIPLAWLPGPIGAGTTSSPNLLPGFISTAQVEQLALEDMNGDGLKDLIVSAERVYLLPNTSIPIGTVSFAVQDTIPVLTSFSIADMDEDGDLDVVGIYFASTKIGLSENDGAGNFSFAGEINDPFGSVRDVYAGDLDGDGDADIVAGTNAQRLVWIENLGGTTFSLENTISSSIGGFRELSVADFDNDGDSDIVSLSANDRTVALYRNLYPQNCSDQPINLTGSFAPATPSGGLLSFDWSTTPGAVSYAIKIRRIIPAVPPKTKNFTTATNSFSINSPLIQPGDAFEWKVRALCPGSALGQWSEWETLSIPVLRPLLNENLAITHSVHPNPASGVVTFNINTPELLALNISDISGQSMHSAEVNTGIGTTSVNLDGWPTGIYLYSLSTKTGAWLAEGKLFVIK